MEFIFIVKKKKKPDSVYLPKINELSALKVENLSFRYRPSHPLALKEVNFEIQHGDYVTVIGHNGSGKSTLSKIIIGVLNNMEGSITVFGHKVTSKNINKVRNFLGIVFQNPDNQFIGSTVQDDIAFGLENRQIASEKMKPIILEVASKVGMENFLDSEPLMLSGGQKQRVAIASALALSPEILILDEATSMLDPKGKIEIKNIVNSLKAKRNKTIISITHDMDEILHADKVLVMNKGMVLKYDTPLNILQDESFLADIHLDSPFLLKLSNLLIQKGFPIKKYLYEKDFIVALCEKLK